MSNPIPAGDLKAWQHEHDLCDVHVVSLGSTGFTVAHTDEERAAFDHEGRSLEQCELHVWLLGLDEAPEALGLYIAVPHEPDAYSEPYRADPWDLEPVEAIS